MDNRACLPSGQARQPERPDRRLLNPHDDYANHAKWTIYDQIAATIAITYGRHASMRSG